MVEIALLVQKEYMYKEINRLILSVLELYKKNRVDGGTPEVLKFADELVAFATQHSLEDEVRRLREPHLPTRFNQQMTVEGTNAIIEYLLSLQSRFVEAPAEVKAILHPDRIRVAESRMVAGQYADAVESAFKELNNAVKNKVRSKLGRGRRTVIDATRIFVKESDPNGRSES